MKDKTEYWADAFKELGVEANDQDIGLRAVEMCQEDHIKFVNDISQDFHNLKKIHDEMVSTIEGIIGPLQDQSPS